MTSAETKVHNFIFLYYSEKTAFTLFSLLICSWGDVSGL